MVITEVRIKLCDENNERLLAFCSVTLDHAFVVRDLKVIDGTKGTFVAMPSRKLNDRCGPCGHKNHLRARYCNHCGARLDEHRALRVSEGRAKLHADIAHPINSGSRELMQLAVVRAYQDEKAARNALPGYVCRYDDYDSDYDDCDAAASFGPAALPAGYRARRGAPGEGAHRGGRGGRAAFGAGILESVSDCPGEPRHVSARFQSPVGESSRPVWPLLRTGD